ncbi:sterol carrier family protein [Actinoplanes sp. NPDC026619]|uniref:sterol carrier family protein n=1 Tax=Actinoplanes sp. NPDC026619 TaxID=3155798 RepID=UPI0033FCB847
MKQALDALDRGVEPDRPVLRDAVRALLTELSRRAPGRSVEVRIPPFGAIQCVAGPRHTRGTPPNVVETDPVTWVLVATERVSWADALRDGRLRASGNRTDLTDYLPLNPPDGEE